MNNGWIKLHRRLTEWEWYNDSQTVHLFIHILLKANHSEKKWRGVTVKSGQFITSRDKLSSETGISVRSIRTILNRLKATNEVTNETTNKYTIVTVCNWESYQSIIGEDDQQSDHQPVTQPTNNRPATDQQPTTNKNDKNDKNVEEQKKETPKPPKGANSGYTAEFEYFWKAYGKKGSKANAFKRWKKLKPEEKHDALAAIDSYFLENPDPQYRKDGEGYLNGKLFESVLERQRDGNLIIPRGFNNSLPDNRETRSYGLND